MKKIDKRSFQFYIKEVNLIKQIHEALKAVENEINLLLSMNPNPIGLESKISNILEKYGMIPNAPEIKRIVLDYKEKVNK